MLRVLGQQIDARQQHVAQGWRQVIVLDPPVSHRAQQLLDEQRNPLRPLEQQVDELAVGALIEDRLDLGADLLGAEPLELQPLHRALLVPPSGHAAKRMRPVQLVVAHRADQQRVTGQSPHEQCDQVERRAVGPLHVLEDEHQRPLGGQARDEPENKLRNSGCTVVGGAHLLAGLELGEQPGDLAPCRAQALAELVDSELGGERAQHLDERSERDPLTSELDAAADEHARAGLVGPPAELVDQPRLADAGLATYEDRRGLSGNRPLQGAIEHRELSLTTDQHRADEAGGHSVIFPVQSPGAGLAEL